MIPGWDKFQHYRDRRPVWIKDYPEQLDREEYRALSPTARALLQDLRRLYALSDGIVAKNTVLSRLGRGYNAASNAARSRHWKELTDAGFIQLSASKPLALARAREETEKEKDIPKSLRNHKPRNAKVTGWRLVRGSHGQTHIPDPQGTDRPPPEVRT